jgi:hypothetical protein
LAMRWEIHSTTMAMGTHCQDDCSKLAGKAAPGHEETVADVASDDRCSATAAAVSLMTR